MNARPNILWIVTTQWRAQACGYAGDANARTPNLDALAAQSIDYTQAVTPHPFGPFARAALLTGRPSPENGVRDYFDPLPIAARTIAHELNERGLATAFFGKWHLAPRDRDAELVGETHAKTIVPPEMRGGFEFWEGFESGFLLNDPWLHGSRLEQPKKIPGYQSEVIARRAAAWCREQRRDRPWFCVASLEPPHPPYDAPAGGVARKEPAQIVLPRNVPLGGEVEQRARRELAGYYAHIEATDRAIGQLMGDLESSNPLIVFTSVHGDMHGAHGFFRKGWPHEESVRVPLLVSAPGRESRGRRDDRTVSLIDLPQWTIGWAEGRPTPASHENYRRISMPSVVARPHQCDRAWHGVRTASRKLILNADGSVWLFFDLDSDPGEMRNLAGETARAPEAAQLRRSAKL